MNTWESTEYNLEELHNAELQNASIGALIIFLWKNEIEEHLVPMKTSTLSRLGVPQLTVSSKQFLKLIKLVSESENISQIEKIFTNALLGKPINYPALKSKQKEFVDSLVDLGLIFNHQALSERLQEPEVKVKIKKYLSEISFDDSYESFILLLKNGALLPKAFSVTSKMGQYIIPMKIITLNFIAPSFSGLVKGTRFITKSGRTWNKGLSRLLTGWGPSDEYNRVIDTCHCLTAMFLYYQSFGVTFFTDYEEINTVITEAIIWILSSQNIQPNIDRWEKSEWNEEIVIERITDKESKEIIVPEADGGWGSSKCRKSNVECTALALLVLSDCGFNFDSNVERGYEYLAVEAHEDDGNYCWGDYNILDTALSVAALSTSHNNKYDHLIDGGIKWIISVQNTEEKAQNLDALFSGVKGIDDTEKKILTKLLSPVNNGWPRLKWGGSESIQTLYVLDMFSRLRKSDLDKYEKKINEIVKHINKVVMEAFEEERLTEWSAGMFLGAVCKLLQLDRLDNNTKEIIQKNIDIIADFMVTKHDDSQNKTSNLPKLSRFIIGLLHYFNYTLKDNSKIPIDGILEHAVLNAQIDIKTLEDIDENQ